MEDLMQKRIVRIEIDLPMEFPEDWNDGDIDFHLNKSSWCASNIIDELLKYEEEHGCICGICEFKVYGLSEVKIPHMNEENYSS